MREASYRRARVTRAGPCTGSKTRMVHDEQWWSGRKGGVQAGSARASAQCSTSPCFFHHPRIPHLSPLMDLHR
jgi:hypothetical protein